MPTVRLPARLVISLVNALTAISVLGLAGCGSSTSTVTSPSTLSKCSVAFDTQIPTVAAAGGNGAVTVRAERECQWSAQPDAAWLSITGSSSGQGNGSVQFRAAVNVDPVVRTGAIMVNGQRAQVTQDAGVCHFEIGNASASVPQTGAAGTVDVRASSQLCTWTATSDANWITITSNASGKGSAAVTFTVAPTSGPPRTGTLTIAGQVFTVTQSPGCAFDVTPLAHTVDQSGGTRTVNVSAGAGCAWTASSNDAWIAVTAGATGTGTGSVTLTVAPANGPPRSGTVTVAGQTVTVTQGSGCAFTIAPDSQSVPAAGGTGNVAVTAGAGCAWTAASNAPWIAITSGATGSGNGTVAFRVDPTTGPGRSGTLTIAGRTFTVNQGQGCTFSLSSTSTTAAAAGGPGTFEVHAADGCGWAAASNASWVTITSGATGTGNGVVGYTVAANTGAPRTGTITAAGQTFEIAQSAGCSFSIAPADQSMVAAGGTGSFNVTTAAGCAWTATANAPWISISSGASGSGPGAVQFSVAANSSTARSGTITAGGQTFTVNQDAGCSATVVPDTIAEPSAGGQQNVNITIAAGCAWTASSGVPWVAIQNGASGTGNGVTQLDIQANTGPARTGTATVAGKTVTINQDSGCTFVVAPTTLNAPVGTASGAVTVTTAAGCTWTAVSNVSWITITSGAGGTGNGTVQGTVDANQTGAARTGTLTIAGQTVTVNQAGQ